MVVQSSDFLAFWFVGVFSSARGSTGLKLSQRGDLEVVDMSFECMLGSNGVV